MDSPSLHDGRNPRRSRLLPPEPLLQADRAPAAAREARAAVKVRREVCMLFLRYVPDAGEGDVEKRRRVMGHRFLISESSEPFSRGAPRAAVTRSR